jgi:Mechanosensitive ion channel, conserved TM helix
MASPLENILNSISEQVIGYLPNLLAGAVLIGIGWLLGWLAKRIVVQMLTVLRFDRLLRRFKWSSSFSKADVRFAVYEWIGSAVFLVVFLVLFNASLDAMKLTTLSTILSEGVLFIPKLVIALVLLSLGWIVAGWIGGIIQRALVKEDVPRTTLIVRFTKAVMMLFFSAMALTEIDVAREIVVIGFSVTMLTLGGITIVLAGVGAKSFVARVLEDREK